MQASTLPHLRRASASARTLALSACVLALVVLAPAQALAKRRGPACRPGPAAVRSAAAHVKRGGHSCAARPKKRSRRHHATRRAVGTGKRKAASHRAPSAPAQSSVVGAASCEDGREPFQAEPEVFECADGSEPGCHDGSQLSSSSDGARLLCSAGTPTGDDSSGDSSDSECPASVDPAEDDEGDAGVAGDAAPACSATDDSLEAESEPEG